VNDAADCVIIRVCNEKFSGAMCPSISHNFEKNTCKHCNIKGTSPYLELKPGSRSVTIQKLPVIAGDPVTICCDYVTFVEYEE